MVDSKYLMLNTEFFNIECEIKHYHYNFNYKIWTLTFNDGNVFFVYDENINNLTIIKNDIGIVGYVVNKKLIKYDDEDEIEKFDI